MKRRDLIYLGILLKTLVIILLLGTSATFKVLSLSLVIMGVLLALESFVPRFAMWMAIEFKLCFKFDTKYLYYFKCTSKKKCWFCRHSDNVRELKD